jgi:GNAT superfamily N-acetyltransferase
MNILTATEQEAESIDKQLVDFNSSQVPFTQDPHFIKKNYVIKENGEIIAGLNAIIYCWKILYIDILFVDERHRDKDLGTNLINQLEKDAKEMGATLAHLDTLDFQAKDFYLKRGYEVFGVLDDCPPGHKRYYLKKVL